ncbi:MAG TPA: hypothetical protein VFN87_07790 [Solirubrobacteraceae bacterium]|nr:hypothetical protein [Solirubrobacteraceae bacterium]
MSAPPSSSATPDRPIPPAASSWLHARALWAGVSIVTMWLAVLFVGVFGGDFVSSSSTGFTKIPVVVFLLPFVLPASISVGRRGFAGSSDDPGHRRRDDTPQPREEPPTGRRPEAA